MFYENVVVPLDLGQFSTARLKLAVGLAARFDARLIGIAAREVSRRHGHGKGGLITSKMVDSERRHTIYELSLVKDAFDKETDNVKISEFHSSVSDPEFALVNGTRSADLVVCNRPFDGGINDWFADVAPGALLMRLGCPLLVAPLGFNGEIGRRIVIAWKDTREARRAVREAWPFLKSAECVSILTVGSENEAIGAKDMADSLSRKDLSCKAVRIDKTRLRVSDEILKFATDAGADLLVTGAYGNARVHELVYGSVTRDLLNTSPVSCLMSR